MIILGTIVNVLAVLLGSLAGLMFHSRLSKRYTDIIFQAIGLFTIILGVMMALRAQEWLVVILSLIIGGVVGEALQLESFFDQLASRLGARFKAGGKNFNEGLLTAFLLFCMGSMTVLGAVEEGMGGKPELYYIKSVMDGISAIALASGMGIGVLFSIIPLFIYQSALTFVAYYFGSFMPELMIASISATGGVLLLGLGLNLLHIAKIKMLNLLPSLAFAAFFAWLYPMIDIAGWALLLFGS